MFNTMLIKYIENQIPESQRTTGELPSTEVSYSGGRYGICNYLSLFFETARKKAIAIKRTGKNFPSSQRESLNQTGQLLA